MDSSISTWRKAAETAALMGAEQLEFWRSRFQVREKGHADVVTEADLASQQAIKTYLHTEFPDHAFVGEEDFVGARMGTFGLPNKAQATWVVDPLDGTANYVHDCPMYCVSVGLMVDNQVVVGVIYDPRQKEMFSAGKGQGATLNGKPIQVSNIASMNKALVSTGFPPDPELQEKNLSWWRLFSYHAQALRRTGSTALNMAYVAAGRFGAYWAFDNYAWDVAGGLLLIQEAGGLVTRCDGTPADPFQPDILAANPSIHAEMLKMLTGNHSG